MITGRNIQQIQQGFRAVGVDIKRLPMLNFNDENPKTGAYDIRGPMGGNFDVSQLPQRLQEWEENSFYHHQNDYFTSISGRMGPMTRPLSFEEYKAKGGSPDFRNVAAVIEGRMIAPLAPSSTLSQHGVIVVDDPSTVYSYSSDEEGDVVIDPEGKTLKAEKPFPRDMKKKMEELKKAYGDGKPLTEDGKYAKLLASSSSSAKTTENTKPQSKHLSDTLNDAVTQGQKYLNEKQQEAEARSQQETEQKTALKNDMIRNFNPRTHPSVITPGQYWEMSQEIANVTGGELSRNFNSYYTWLYHFFQTPEGGSIDALPENNSVKKGVYRAIQIVLPEYYEAVIKDRVNYKLTQQYMAGGIPDVHWSQIMDQPDGTLMVFDDTTGLYGRPTGYIKMGKMFYPYYDKINGNEMKIINTPPYDKLSKVIQVRSTSLVVVNFGGNMDLHPYPGTMAGKNPNKYFELKRVEDQNQPGIPSNTSGGSKHRVFLPDSSKFLGIPGTEIIDDQGNKYYQYYVDFDGNKYRLERPNNNRLDAESYLEQISGDPALEGYRMKPKELKEKLPAIAQDKGPQLGESTYDQAKRVEQSLRQQGISINQGALHQGTLHQGTASITGPETIAAVRHSDDGESVDNIIIKGIQDFISTATNEIAFFFQEETGRGTGRRCEESLGRS
jgi:hypothetical protein